VPGFASLGPSDPVSPALKSCSSHGPKLVLENRAWVGNPIGKDRLGNRQ